MAVFTLLVIIVVAFGAILYGENEGKFDVGLTKKLIELGIDKHFLKLGLTLALPNEKDAEATEPSANTAEAALPAGAAPVETNGGTTPPPTPKDCDGTWGAWGACVSSNGKSCGPGEQKRTFSVTQQSSNGGMSCDEKKSMLDGGNETKGCENNPCPVPCRGSWGEWSECDAVCGPGTQTRQFIVEGMPSRGGKKCADPETKACNNKPCEKDAVARWGEWAPCTANCGPSGTQAREWICEKNAEGGGKTCSAMLQEALRRGEQRIRPCNRGACPKDCQGSWGAWGPCSKTCGGGKKRRTYNRSQEKVGTGADCPAANGQIEEVDCNTQVCPVNCVGQWQSTGACQGACGTSGSRTETYRISQNKKGAGSACPAVTGATRSVACQMPACKVDCKGTWGGWGACSKTCGGGTQTRTWTQTQARVGAGAPCPTVKQDTRACNTQACPQDCQGRWGPWGACSKKCGGGTKTRSWITTRPQRGSGKSCAQVRSGSNTAPCNTQKCENETVSGITPSASPRRGTQYRYIGSSQCIQEDNDGLGLGVRVLFGHLRPHSSKDPDGSKTRAACENECNKYPWCRGITTFNRSYWPTPECQLEVRKNEWVHHFGKLLSKMWGYPFSKIKPGLPSGQVYCGGTGDCGGIRDSSGLKARTRNGGDRCFARV